MEQYDTFSKRFNQAMKSSIIFNSKCLYLVIPLGMLILERGSGGGDGSEATYADLAFSIPSAICLQGGIVQNYHCIFPTIYWQSISSCITSWSLR